MAAPPGSTTRDTPLCGSATGVAEYSERYNDDDILELVRQEQMSFRGWAAEWEERTDEKLERHLQTITALLDQLRGSRQAVEQLDSSICLPPPAFEDTTPPQAFATTPMERVEAGVPWSLGCVEQPTSKAESVEKVSSEQRGRRASHVIKESPLLRRVFGQKLSDWLDLWESLEEPPRSGPLASILRTSWFDMCCTAVIVANGLVTWVATDQMVSHSGTPAAWVKTADYCFLAFYCAELVIKLVVHRTFFFIGPQWSWNVFDFLIVLTGIADVIMELATDGFGGNVKLVFVRILRLLRLAKSLRGLRALKFFTELRVILLCVLGAMSSMFWSIVTLAFTFYLFSLVFVQGVASELSEGGDICSSEVLEHFGSVRSAMLTLYMASMGGNDWGHYYGIIFPDWNKVVFLLFIFFMQVTLLNVITGIFVDNAMKRAKPDTYTMALELHRQEMQDECELERICMEVGIGERISQDELVSHWRSGQLRTYMSAFGLSAQDPELLFQTLTRGGRERDLAIGEFVQGCMQLSGPASNLELMALGLQIERLAGYMCGASSGGSPKGRSSVG